MTIYKHELYELYKLYKTLSFPNSNRGMTICKDKLYELYETLSFPIFLILAGKS
jgi:hypothetical protein